MRKKSLKQVILEALEEKNVGHARVFLFGSRAWKRARRESDWDLFVLVERDLAPQEVKDLWLAVYQKLHERFPTESFDVVVKSQSAFEREKDVANTLASEVVLEGQEL